MFHDMLQLFSRDWISRSIIQEVFMRRFGFALSLVLVALALLGSSPAKGLHYCDLLDCCTYEERYACRDAFKACMATCTDSCEACTDQHEYCLCGCGYCP